MLHSAQQLRIDPYESRECPCIELIILALILPDRSHVARVRHDRLMTEFN